jgi:hypothetical protein
MSGLPQAAILRRPRVVDADRHRQQLPHPPQAARPLAQGVEPGEAQRLAEPPRRLAQRQQGAVPLRLPLVPPTRT